ncbi:hypothetical protein [Desulfobulbus elongatus]|uniref:hypothetical protein n=1 Tax=Desulfobulbus elongatus TaxID=53332 RepID=UPI0004808463|nr:hypothetical protein [Desulfobulbus elongatus]
MSDQALRAAIRSRLLALGAGIGKVHDYGRWANTPADFKTLFQDANSKKIFGWEISRIGLKVSQGRTMHTRRVAHRYMITGYYGLDDAAGTEKTVGALVDQIVVQLASVRLPGTVNDLMPAVNIETRMFGGLLCHVAEIVLPEVTEILDLNEQPADEYLEAVGLEYYLTPGDDQPDAIDLVTLSPEGE